MARQIPWRRICPEVVSDRIQQASEASIYLLRQTGPTGFLLNENGGDKNFKVYLGDKHSCTCSTFMREKELCIHILWVLLKKFRVPKENPVIHQLCLVEREINEVIRGMHTARQRASKIEYETITLDGRETKEQKEISEEDVCPICQEEFVENDTPLTYCKFGCGNNVHLKCMKIWADHQKSTGENIIKCPLCRVDFGTYQDLMTEYQNASRKKTRAERNDIHLGAKCSGCRMCPINGKCYRCITCADSHLCHECFAAGVHSQHSFQWRQKSSQRWRPATRPTPLPMAVVNEMEGRELTDGDYEMLLQLDRNQSNETQGVPERVLNAFPINVLRDGSSLLTSRSRCGICLRDYRVSQIVQKLPCRHQFHRECIGQWLSDHLTCPVDGQTVYDPWNTAPDVIATAHRRKTTKPKPRPNSGHQNSGKTEQEAAPAFDFTISGSSLHREKEQRSVHPVSFPSLSSPAQRSGLSVASTHLSQPGADSGQTFLDSGSPGTSTVTLLSNIIFDPKGRPPKSTPNKDIAKRNKQLNRRVTSSDSDQRRKISPTIPYRRNSLNDISVGQLLSVHSPAQSPSPSRKVIHGSTLKNKRLAQTSAISSSEPNLSNGDFLITTGLSS